jgi:hypothetical protein
MIKGIILIPSRVACQTSLALIDITIHPVVFIVGPWIGMTNQTVESGKVTRSGMTIYTFRPFTLVRTGIDRKVLAIMLTKIGWAPSGIGRMAVHAAG